MSDFKPTWLYVKRCSHCRLFYFGKTTVQYPELYEGSGLHWIRHLTKHGAHAVHVQARLFNRQDRCTRAALAFSTRYDIVASPDWANHLVEDGLNGAPIGHKINSGRHRYHDGEHGWFLHPGDPRIKAEGLTRGVRQSRKSTLGLCHYNDGIRGWKLLPTDPLIQKFGLVHGTLSAGKQRQVWINNGKEEEAVNRGTKLPIGWARGRIKTGRKFFNDGTHEFKLLPKDAIGMTPGRLPRAWGRPDGCQTTGFRWFNDGTKSFMLNPADPLTKREIFNSNLLLGRLPW